MKKTLFSLGLLSILAASCAKQDVIIDEGPVDPSQKESITFSLSDGTGMTTRVGFTGANTRIVARFQSDAEGKSALYTRTYLKAIKDNSSDATGFSKVEYYTADNTRYWDDAYGRNAKLSVYAVAIPNSEEKTKLTDNILNGEATWNTTSTVNTMSWSVETTAQTDEKLKGEDLVYSNNIKDGGTNGRYVWNYADPIGYPNENGGTDHGNGRLEFTLQNPSETTAAGHFDKGHLVFNHALTRLSVTLVEGTGTDGGFKADDDSDFKFNKGTGNIKLLNFPTSGTFDVSTGEWTSPASTDINQIAGVAATSETEQGAALSGKDTYSAQMLPGYTFTNTGTENVMQFTIDDNTYYITKKMVYDALYATEANRTAEKGFSTDCFTMKQGVHYSLTITVKKKSIDNITATLVDWVDVSGSTNSFNNYVQIAISDKESNSCENFDLYRMNDDVSEIYAPTTGLGSGTDWSKNYNWLGTAGTESSQNYREKATKTKNSDTWKTDWFWESNKSFYHFRTVNEGMTIQDNTTATADYFNIYSGPINNTWSSGNISTSVNDKKFNDYHWGAPFKTSAKMTYSKDYGWSASSDEDGQIYPAIGSTDQAINIIEQHMMANINIVLHTGKLADETDVNNAAIVLQEDSSKKATRVKLTNFYANGQVEMGRGKVTPSGSLTNSDFPVPGSTTINYTDGVLDDASIKPESGYFKTNNEETNSYSYRVVPQTLYRGQDSENETNLNNFIGLTIITPDDNQYYLIKKLIDVTVKEIGTNTHGKEEHTVNNKIQFWYPGYNYTYHIYINKKGIENITCTVANWVDVTGTNQDLNLEN